MCNCWLHHVYLLLMSYDTHHKLPSATLCHHWGNVKIEAEISLLWVNIALWHRWTLILVRKLQPQDKLRRHKFIWELGYSCPNNESLKWYGGIQLNTQQYNGCSFSSVVAIWRQNNSTLTTTVALWLSTHCGHWMLWWDLRLSHDGNSSDESIRCKTKLM